MPEVDKSMLEVCRRWRLERAGGGSGGGVKVNYLTA